MKSCKRRKTRKKYSIRKRKCKLSNQISRKKNVRRTKRKRQKKQRGGVKGTGMGQLSGKTSGQFFKNTWKKSLGDIPDPLTIGSRAIGAYRNYLTNTRPPSKPWGPRRKLKGHTRYKIRWGPNMHSCPVCMGDEDEHCKTPIQLNCCKQYADRDCLKQLMLSSSDVGSKCPLCGDKPTFQHQVMQWLSPQEIKVFKSLKPAVDAEQDLYTGSGRLSPPNNTPGGRFIDGSDSE